ncbi:tetratricopeptide repeat protein 8 [Condylostylus longicornis]|uniref:tetratricopeptide repeat protein 8 n=1 Tax=Condylostylus longicornis TaxID=2530218 RepID=UPI00244E55BA|nr:tetratricopeptide repeat protein 8 [Condylostylus longicornis]XP_055386463.1 tetratricopeptide repeat protein 8 [Condylostylus longicornis]XP_055386464.1 tetratricopeptide repeat protein 8 [Condylostylus longicornis]
MDLKYFQAISLFRRRNYEKCIEVCNALLQNCPSQQLQQAISGVNVNKNTNSSQNDYKKSQFYSNANNNDSKNQLWMIEGIWQLKMRAVTQRIFVDDLETMDDNNIENVDIEFERIATAARPGTSIKTAFIHRPNTRGLISSSTAARPKTLSSRPITGMSRPGTSSNRPGSAISSRPPTRAGTARRIRVTSAAAYSIGDPTSALFQASRLNPTIYAERPAIIKPLFQFLFYHEGDPQKALSLCEAVAEVNKQKIDWWWEQQRGRCYIALNHPRKAENFLNKSLGMLPHPDTYLLLCKLFIKLDEPMKALQLIEGAIEKSPYDISFKTQQARIYELLDKMEDSIKIYRKIAELNPIHPEALACIAVNYFYDNQPEMALMYYRRILSIGVHSAELYCNIGLCCLYGGQIDLVLPCFQRALSLANAPEQRADIWYNLSFVALTTGDFHLAKRCLRLCLSSDSSNGAALNNLAVLSAQFGEYQKAKSYLMAGKSTLIDCPEIENNLKIMEKY